MDAITEIAAALKSGADATLITGTAGSADDLAIWNSDGDLVAVSPNDGLEVSGGNINVNDVTIAMMSNGAITTEGDGIASNDNDANVPTSAAVIDYIAGVAPEMMLHLGHRRR